MSHSHKSSNTFVFKSFNELVDEISISHQRLLHESQATPEDENESYFGLALQKWCDLNVTQHFVSFRREVESKACSYEMVILHKDRIAESLLQHLVVPHSMALTPLLDLVVHLGRDLRSEFYGLYFERFCEILMKLIELEHHNADVLNDVFMCLAILFQTLSRLMLKDIRKIFCLICPLLQHHQSYIRMFAAESFSFLVRKHKEPAELFDYIFKKVNKNRDLVDGVGHVLFETVKGVQKQFNRTTSNVVPILLNKLDGDFSEAVGETLCVMFQLMAEFVNPEHSTSVLQNLIEKMRSDVTRNLKGVLRLLIIWINRNGGTLITEKEAVVAVVASLLERQMPEGDDLDELLATCGRLLLAKNINLDAHHRTRLVSTVFRSGYSYGQLRSFIEELHELPCLEKDALLYLVEYASKLESPSEVLLLVSNLLAHKLPESVDVGGLKGLRPFMLDFSVGGKETAPKFITWLVTELDDFSRRDLNSGSQLEEMWAMVRCLPHLRPINRSIIVEMLPRLMQNLIRNAVDMPATSQVTIQLLNILREAVVTFSYLVEYDQLTVHLPHDIPSKLLSKFAQNEDSLCVVGFYLTCAEETKNSDLLTKEEFDKVFPLLEANLSSPYSQLRRLTLHILSRFQLEASTAANQIGDVRNVFQIGLDAEVIPASFHRYRDKLVQLNKLNCEFAVNRLPTGIAEKVPLDYLVGQLHLNCEPLWKSISELIKSYAVGMKLDLFWDAFTKHLGCDTNTTEGEQDNDGSNNDGCPSEADGSLSQLFGRFWQRNAERRRNDRINFSGFRDRLWTTMQSFPHVCEPRSRIIIPIFFQFLENKYLLHAHDVSSTGTQDLRLPSADGDDDGEDEAEEEPMELGEATELEKDGRRKNAKPVQHRIGKRALDRILVVHLSLFALFRDGKSLPQAPRLLEFYLDLLKHQSPVVQKAAFDCIMTYKPKYLIPYRENFERLISEKTFRNEVVLFSINAESQVINAEHRNDLIPILMRILYGKMRLKMGKDANGRTQGQVRKNVVLAFLANSRPEEINHFLDLILQPFSKFFTDDLSEKVKEIAATVDISKAIPLRKQQSILTSVEMIFLKLGNIIDLYVPKLIQLIIGLGAYSAALLSKRSELAPKSVALLKTIRNAVLARINEFFNQFDKYHWSVGEVVALFDALVWPQIEKLPVEGIHNPTGLLRLCLTWSSNPRYFPLLVKCSQSQPSVIPLPLVLRLLESKNVEASVTDVVMNVVENLLTEEEEEDVEEEDGEKKAPVIDPGSMWKIPVDGKEKGTGVPVPYGTAMVLLFSQFIVPYLVKVIEGMAADSGSKRFVPPRREIRILSCLSTHVTDASQCCQVAELLLRILGLRKNLGVDTEVDLLTSVRNMVDTIQQPLQLLPMIWCLFDRLTEASSRMQLCTVMTAMATKEPLLEKTASVVQKLNSWQESRLNEPDFELRDDGHKEAMRILAQPELDVNFVLMIVHNCCYFTTTPNDNSSACLNRLILKLAEQWTRSDVFQEVVIRHLLPIVKLKLKVKDKLCRNVFVEKLRMMILHFTDCSHFVSLRRLLNETDRERDFFLNLIHIQAHRQSRAVQDLAEFLRRNTLPASVLTSYILPLVMAILRNDDDFSSQHVLRDFTIRALGSLCLCLPWESYCTMLLSCLRALLRGKQSTKLNVRILVSVLNSFHFDLCNSQFKPDVAGVDKQETKVVHAVEEVEAEDEEEAETAVPDDATEQMDVDGNDVGTATPTDAVMAAAGGVLLVVDAECRRMDVCPAGRATYIHRTIMMKILPQLQKCLIEKAKSDSEHKMARTDKVAEDIEILRVPLAVAMVKLLKVLPNAELERNLSGILMKVIRFLQSRAKEIRLISYETLRNIVVSLGPFYLRHVISELKLMLTRGYQLHVLCYAIWCLLDEFQKQNVANLAAAKKPFIQPGDIDSCVVILTQIFNMELFHEVAEEKEVEEIAGKLFEAKRTKSGESYGLLAAFVSEDSFPVLISSLKKILETTRSHKIVNTTSNALTAILGSAVDNSSLSLRFHMEFIHAVTSKALSTFKSTGESNDSLSKADPRLQPPNCLLLKRAPPRGGKKPKTDARANLHVLIDFGFQLLHKLLNLGRIVVTDRSHLELLDPFVGLVTESLDSKHVKVTSSALKCLSKICELPVPSLRRHFRAITNHLFVLLQGYTVTGSGSGPNEEMVAWSFKAITALIKHQRGVQITSEQLHVLLLYAEQDINDLTRHATAFPLLSAIVARKLDAKELQQVVLHLELMSIREIPEVQAKCRKVISSYLLNYPLKDKQLEKHLDFYVTQLSCDFMFGRQGAIEMLKDFFRKFPQEVLTRWKFKFFLPLVQSCVEDVDCRESLRDILKQFLTRLDNSIRDELISCCLTMMKDETDGVLVSGAMAIGCIVEVEKDGFRRHLHSFLPLIRAQISPEKCSTTAIDVLFHYLDLFFKIVTECDVLRNPKFTKALKSIWELIEVHLKHGSSLIQLKTGHLFLQLFASWTESELVDARESSESPEYLVSDIDSKLYDLCGSFCHQFSAPDISRDLASTVMCNLLFLGRVLLLRRKAKSVEMKDGEEEGVRPKASFNWLLKRLSREIKEEIQKRKRESIVKREHVFSWLEGIAQNVDYELIVPHLSFMVKPLVREKVDSETGDVLKELAERVLKVIETRAAEAEKTDGVELNSFETAYRAIHKKILTQKQTRKNLLAAQAVTDPERFAKKKLKKNLAKKESKKRKTKPGQPSKGSKRRRLASKTS